MRLVRTLFPLLVSFAAASCTADTPTSPRSIPARAPEMQVSSSDPVDVVGELPGIGELNGRLALKGIPARLTAIKLLVNKNYPPGAPTVYVVDRNRYLDVQFVATDPRRGNVVGLTWTYDLRRGNALTQVNGVPGPWTSAMSLNAARDNVNTWTGLSCYKAFFAEVPYPVSPNNLNIEIVDDFYLGGESQPFAPVAEITYGGFLPLQVFLQLFGPNGVNVVGVTFQFAFADGSGLTDIDGNGKPDGFWSEIYFNGGYYWGDLTLPGFDPIYTLDIGTVGLHEAGHAFGLGHWGKTFESRGGVKFASDNIMSEHITLSRSVAGEPTGAFCGIYANWR